MFNDLRKMGVELSIDTWGTLLATLIFRHLLRERIQVAQTQDSKLLSITNRVNRVK